MDIHQSNCHTHQFIKNLWESCQLIDKCVRYFQNYVYQIANASIYLQADSKSISKWSFH